MKQRFLSDPHPVLAEHGMDVPEGINVNVVENADNTVHITMPAAPDGHQDLSDEELRAAAGGGTVMTFMSVALNADTFCDPIIQGTPIG